MVSLSIPLSLHVPAPECPLCLFAMSHSLLNILLFLCATHQLSPQPGDFWAGPPQPGAAREQGYGAPELILGDAGTVPRAEPRTSRVPAHVKGPWWGARTWGQHIRCVLCRGGCPHPTAVPLAGPSCSPWMDPSLGQGRWGKVAPAVTPPQPPLSPHPILFLFHLPITAFIHLHSTRHPSP